MPDLAEPIVASAPESSPAPVESPSSAPESAPKEAADNIGQEMDSVLDRVEARSKPKTTEPTEPKTKPAAPENKPKATITTKPVEKAPEKPADKPVETGPRQLREELARVKKEHADSVAKIADYERRFKEADAKNKDTAALASQLESERKEKEGLMGKIRRLTKQNDPVIEAPFEKEAKFVRSRIQKLQVGEMREDADTGNLKWTPTGLADYTKDFAKLWHLYHDDPTEAYRQIQDKFGYSAQSVVGYINQLDRIDYEKGLAVDAAEQNWKEDETREQANAAAAKEAYQRDTQKAREALVNESPEYFGERPDDQEHNDLLKEGRELMEYVPKTRDEEARLHARLRLYTEGYPALKRIAEKRAAEIEELKQTIEEMKNSGPGKTRRTGGEAGAAEPMTMEEELRKAAQM